MRQNQVTNIPNPSDSGEQRGEVSSGYLSRLGSLPEEREGQGGHTMLST